MTGPSKKLYAAFLAATVCGCVYHVVPEEFQSTCAADDPRVGQIAELTDRFIHGVRGTARIVDNCTINIEHFYYDGIAVDSRWVGVVNEDWLHVTVLSGPQMRTGGYVDETIVIHLPDGVTLDDVPTISLSCLPGIDFLGNGNLAEGVFHAP